MANTPMVKAQNSDMARPMSLGARPAASRMLRSSSRIRSRFRDRMRPVGEDPGHPPVFLDDSAQGVAELREPPGPGLVRIGQHQLGQDRIGGQQEQLVLAVHVPVGRHGRGAHLGPQQPHGETFDPDSVDQLAGGGHQRLLLASDESMADEAKALAEQLEGENTRRRAEDQDILAKAKKIVETDPDVGSRSVLVVAGEGWHRGVIGIVASKLVDAFYRPAIVLSIDGDIAHGSCRSIAGFNMLAALESCAPLMKRFGGHKAAAGLQLDSSRIKEFRQAVNAHADTCLGPDDLRPTIWLDGPLAFQRDQRSRDGGIRGAGAVRPGNPRPRFHTGPVAIVDGPRILKERHLKLSVKQNGRVIRAIQWNAAEREPASHREEGRRRDRLHGGRERIPWATNTWSSARRFPLADLTRGRRRHGKLRQVSCDPL